MHRKYIVRLTEAVETSARSGARRRAQMGAT
jgi:hypothetical protein